MEKLEDNKSSYLKFVNRNKPNTTDKVNNFFTLYEENSNQLNGDKYSLDELDETILFLDLSKRNLKSIPKELLKCINLLAIDLSGNVIEDFSGLEQLKKIEVIFLDNCKLDLIPKEIYKLNEITSINITNNNISVIDEGIKELKKLTGLNLINNQILILPSFLFEFENLIGIYVDGNLGIDIEEFTGIEPILKELQLSGCDLVSLPKALCNLINLKSIELIDNKLSELPSEFKNLTNLVSINLSYNNLKVIPKEIMNLLPNLKSLELDNNQLSSNECDFSTGEKLLNIELSNNRLRQIPQGINSLKNLIYLELKNNKLEYIEEDTFVELTKLETLDLSNNRLNNIPDSIENLINLKYLSLSNNNLKYLSPNIGKLTNLTTLLLTNYPFYRTDNSLNQLKSLPTEIGNLKNLVVVDISENLLEDLPNEFANLRKLTSLRKENNPFSSAPELVNMGIDELFEFLNRRRGLGSFTLKWEIAQPLQTAFQRYFDNFSNFYKKVQGVDIQFEVIKENSGLLFKFHPNEEANLEQISSVLFEYVELLEQDREHLSVFYNGNSISQYEFDLLIADLREEKRSFEAKVEIAKMEAKYKDIYIGKLDQQIDTFKSIICGYQQIALEQAGNSKKNLLPKLETHNHLNMPSNNLNLSNFGNSTSTNSNSSSSKSVNQTTISITIGEFQDKVADAIGEINFTLKELNKEKKPEVVDFIKELESFNEVLEKASNAQDKKEIKKLGLKGFIKGISKSIINIYDFVSDADVIESLKKAIETISENIEKLG